MASGHMTRPTDRANTHTSMGRTTKDCGKTTFNMGKGKKCGKMELPMTVITFMAKSTGEAYTRGPTAQVTQDSGQTTLSKERCVVKSPCRGPIDGRMGVDIWVCGRTTRCTALEYIHGPVARSILGLIHADIRMATASTTGLTDVHIKAGG